MIFQHVCICRDMLGLTNLVLRMWKLSVRLFSKQPGRSRIIIQLIVSFFLKCSKTAGQTTPPPAQKKRNQVDTGIVRSVFQGRRWVEFVLVLHRHSYTTNLPKSACRCPQEGGGEVKEGRAWTPPIHYHRLKCIKKKSRATDSLTFSVVWIIQGLISI